MLSRVIAEARQIAGLSHDQFAALLELDPATIWAWESGSQPVDPTQLDVIARLFGFDVPQFLAADLRTTPSALLYRSMAAERSIERFADIRLPHQLGEFLQCVRILAECEQLAGTPVKPSWLDEMEPVPLPLASRTPHGAEELASRVRAALGLGNEPIASMQGLLRESGIALFFANPDTLHPAVDAACTLHPRAAILVNVTAGGDAWWRTRMSLAHELAHLCFDSDVLGVPRRLFLFSPAERTERSWHLVERFEALEQRASAFAAYFLAPPAAVRTLVSRGSEASPAALQRVAQHFGVGHETAANVLTNVFGLSDVQRSALLAAPHVELAPVHPDRIVRPRLRDDAFVDRVLALHRDDVIDGVRARRWLRLATHDALPARCDLTDEQRAPCLSSEDRARLRVNYLLRHVIDDASLHVGPIDAGDPASICVFVVRTMGIDRVEPTGHVLLDPADLRVLATSGSALTGLRLP